MLADPVRGIEVWMSDPDERGCRATVLQIRLVEHPESAELGAVHRAAALATQPPEVAKHSFAS